jgi:tetratricopeptide (TPR) repeat protein
MKAAAVLSLVALLTACAAKTAPLPPPITTPKFPDFVHPVPPQGTGTPAALERHQIAWQWLQAGDLRAAERNFASALRQSATFYPAEVGLGYVALASKKHKESLLHFDRAVVANPRYAPALAGRADALLAMGEVDEAVTSIEAALTADPGLGALRSRLEVLRFRNQQEDIDNARKLASAGRLDEARGAYRGLIDASPASAFLLRELADVERRAGNNDAALDYAGKSVELEPEEARGHLLLGDLYEAKGDAAKAVDALTAAANLQPSEALSERIAALRSRAAFEAMPPEYRSIETSPTVTRAQLAALLAVRLDDLLVMAPRVSAVVITDTRGSWAAPHILSVARTGVMEVYPNHTFQPGAIVRRADLAQAASRVLQIIAARNPQLGAAWRDSSRRKFADLGPRHLSHPAVSLVVEAGVMATRENGTFDLTDLVTGAEAVTAVTKLQELGGRTGQ